MVYTFWSSHCDYRPYTGWIIGYNESTLTRSRVLDITPNGSEGSIWASGAGPAADSGGNIYFLAGNGTFATTLDANGFPIHHDYGNVFLKISTANHRLTVAESSADEDFGSGKDRNIYVVNRDNMGKFSPTANHIWQELPQGFGGPEFGMPAYFNGTLYYGAAGDVIRAFSIRQAKLSATPVSETTNRFPYPGATPSISADGSRNAILWAVDNSNPAVLYAYDAGNLAHELYDSNQAGSRNRFGPGNKFITPNVANGKVFVGTTDGVAVFGLLH